MSISGEELGVSIPPSASFPIRILMVVVLVAMLATVSSPARAQITFGVVPGGNDLIQNRTQARALALYLSGQLSQDVYVQLFKNTDILNDWINLVQQIDLAVLPIEYVRQQPVDEFHVLARFPLKTSRSGLSDPLVARQGLSLSLLNKVQLALQSLGRTPAGQTVLDQLESTYEITRPQGPNPRPPTPVQAPPWPAGETGIETVSAFLAPVAAAEPLAPVAMVALPALAGNPPTPSLPMIPSSALRPVVEGSVPAPMGPQSRPPSAVLARGRGGTPALSVAPPGDSLAPAAGAITPPPEAPQLPSQGKNILLTDLLKLRQAPALPRERLPPAPADKLALASLAKEELPPPPPGPKPIDVLREAPPKRRVYIVPFATLMVPGVVAEGVFDDFVDRLNEASEQDGTEFIILKSGTEKVGHDWLASRTYVTGELFGYIEDSGCCSTEIRARARLHLFRPGQPAPVFDYELPVKRMFDHDRATLDQERSRIASQIADTLSAQVLQRLQAD